MARPVRNAVATPSLPATIGGCADRLYALVEAKRVLARQIEELEKEESLIKSYLIDEVSKQDSTGVRGRIAQAKIVTKVVPSANDWEAIYEYITTNQAFQLLQRRLSPGAVKEIWDQDGNIPGIEEFTAVTVSVTKL